MSQNNLIWIASYPKSGNTWFRLLLTQLLSVSRNALPSENRASLNLNDIYVDQISSSRQLFENYLNVTSSDLFPNEIEGLRPQVFRRMSAESDRLVYLKTHEAYTLTSKQEPLFPPDATKCAIYLVRNPLDISVSYAHHFSCSIDESIAALNDKNHGLAQDPMHLYFQLPQKLLSWSEHVRSWLETKKIRVLVVRYEDLKLNPVSTLMEVVDFLKLPSTGENIRFAIKQCEFEKLKAQEQKSGFSEKLSGDVNFFRSGRMGEWREVLSPGQVSRLVETHRTIMTKLHYLDSQGNPF
ncbi:sulfotransferase [Oleiphilus messinensis]|uniref:Sulfotransferase n=1 Tax=Oleiphilus messinensis TaxID=141451 RepID=A0A1Y0I4K0_9GAMM|nr:sulfotransferase domain-containing protein [Oleiphilus messinensis]ARU54384.1 sulfotransferase [Oleiphilus messinensis]